MLTSSSINPNINPQIIMLRNKDHLLNPLGLLKSGVLTGARLWSHLQHSGSSILLVYPGSGKYSHGSSIIHISPYIISTHITTATSSTVPIVRNVSQYDQPSAYSLGSSFIFPDFAIHKLSVQQLSPECVIALEILA